MAFIGATDTAAAESFLRKLIAFAEESNGTEYEEGVTRGYLTFVVDPSDDVSAHPIALTDDYIVIATGAETLGIGPADRMDSGQDQDRPSLFYNPGFQEAREAAESPRFGIMYVDIAGMIDQLGESFDEEIVDSLRDFSDQLPVLHRGLFVFHPDKGIRVSTSFDYPTQDQLFARSCVYQLRGVVWTCALRTLLRCCPLLGCKMCGRGPGMRLLTSQHLISTFEAALMKSKPVSIST